jgi:hypothetical protein
MNLSTANPVFAGDGDLSSAIGEPYDRPMHSSDVLRGETFEIEVDGRPTSHSAFFADFAVTRRLGVVAPGRIDGAGAMSMIIAAVTAFYDRYRAAGDEFFTYPDFYAFVPSDKPAPSYGMFDVWPDHKVVQAGPEPLDTLWAIADRAINVLLIPDGEPKDNAYDGMAPSAALRCIDTCYAYSFDGPVSDADVTIRFPTHPMLRWVTMMFDSVADEGDMAARKAAWLERNAHGSHITQSYRRIDVDTALRML